jgi:hypothetical protein
MYCQLSVVNFQFKSTVDNAELTIGNYNGRGAWLPWLVREQIAHFIYRASFSLINLTQFSSTQRMENCNRIIPMKSGLLATNLKKQREIAILKSFQPLIKCDQSNGYQQLWPGGPSCRNTTEYFTCRLRLRSTACLIAAATVKYNVAYAATVFIY